MSLAAIRRTFARYVTAAWAPPSKAKPTRTERPKDPLAEARKQHLAAGTFVAEDDKVYPVGPCGFVPRSAKFDPARGGP